MVIRKNQRKQTTKFLAICVNYQSKRSLRENVKVTTTLKCLQLRALGTKVISSTASARAPVGGAKTGRGQSMDRLLSVQTSVTKINFQLLGAAQSKISLWV